MKIENTTNPSTGVFVRDARSRPTGKSTAVESDEVKLSELSAQVSSPDEQPFDAARVAQIKQSILEGSFQINVGAIADRLIASAKELVDSQRQG